MTSVRRRFIDAHRTVLGHTDRPLSWCCAAGRAIGRVAATRLDAGFAGRSQLGRAAHDVPQVRPDRPHRYSDYADVLRARSASLRRTTEVLACVGVLLDDRVQAFHAWVDRQIANLAPGIAADTREWALTLTTGDVRTRPRDERSIRGYLAAARPALLAWSGAQHPPARDHPRGPAHRCRGPARPPADHHTGRAALPVRLGQTHGGVRLCEKAARLDQRDAVLAICLPTISRNGVTAEPPPDRKERLPSDGPRASAGTVRDDSGRRRRTPVGGRARRETPKFLSGVLRTATGGGCRGSGRQGGTARRALPADPGGRRARSARSRGRGRLRHAAATRAAAGADAGDAQRSDGHRAQERRSTRMERAEANLPPGVCALLVGPGGQVWETTRSNVFAVIGSAVQRRASAASSRPIIGSPSHPSPRSPGT